MKKKLTKRNILIGIIALFLLMQLFRIDKSIKPVDPRKDFIAITQPNDGEVSYLLKMACYDCHSSQPSYPWYTNIAPVSWWIRHHIDEGQHELNFSEWGSYTDKRKDHKLEECIELVEEGEMPMASYTWMHEEAKLTDAQKLKLVEFFRAVKNGH